MKLYRPKEKHENGDKLVKSKFAWLPTRMHEGSIIWFEWYDIRYKYFDHAALPWCLSRWQVDKRSQNSLLFEKEE